MSMQVRTSVTPEIFDRVIKLSARAFTDFWYLMSEYQRREFEDYANANGAREQDQLATKIQGINRQSLEARLQFAEGVDQDTKAASDGAGLSKNQGGKK